MLINSVEQIKEFLPISAANDFNRLKPFIENAENNYIAKAISKNMYMELDEFAQLDPVPADPTPVQESMIELLRLARISITHLAFWLGFDFLNAHIADGGFKRMEGSTVKSLFKYQEDNLKDYFKVTGLNGIDAMLELLEDKDEHFLEFYVSPEHAQLRSLFIPDTRTFNKIYFIGNSRLIFLRLLPYMRTVDDLVIKHIFGQNAYTSLKNGMVVDPIPPKVTEAMPHIQKVVAFMATAMLMEDSGADLSDRGLYFEGKMSNMTDTTVKNPAEVDRVMHLVKRNRGIGESYIAALKQHLVDYAPAWDEYKPSSYRIPNRDNTNKKSIWV